MTEKQIRMALKTNYKWNAKKFDEFFEGHEGEFTDEDYNRAAVSSERFYIDTYEADHEKVEPNKENRCCGSCKHHKKDKTIGESFCNCEECDCYTVHTDNDEENECPDWERRNK